VLLYFLIHRIVDTVARLLTEANLEEWDNLAQEEIERRRAASLTKIQNLFIIDGKNCYNKY
jgi:uncharacterized protein YnzC (UPF0291/DUF896 family)